jgi:hypothetical protein
VWIVDGLVIRFPGVAIARIRTAFLLGLEPAAIDALLSAIRFKRMRHEDAGT